MGEGKQHYHSLDGLRGLAALVVVFLHYTSAFLPFILGYTAIQYHSRLDHLVMATPLQLPIAGNFAVCIFFVLSGFVLSIKFFKTGATEVLTSSAARRLFRLMIPAVGSIILGYLVLRAGGIFTHEASAASQSKWLLIDWNFPAHIGQALFQGFYGIWFGNTGIKSSYNPVLWTMHFELFGSFLVFMFMALFGKAKNRWLFYAAFGLVFLKTYYLAFLAGMAICDLFISRPDLKEKLTPRMLWFALPVGLVLGTWTTTVDTVYTTAYDRVHLPFFTTLELQTLAHVLGAIIAMLAVLRIEALAGVLTKRPFQYLGKISFALYLTHFIIMGSLSSYLFAHIEPSLGYNAAVLMVFPIGLGASLLVATFYTRWVDVPAIAFSKRAGAYLLSGDLYGGAMRQAQRSARTLKHIKRPLPGLFPQTKLSDSDIEQL